MVSWFQTEEKSQQDNGFFFLADKKRRDNVFLKEYKSMAAHFDLELTLLCGFENRKGIGWTTRKFSELILWKRGISPQKFWGKRDQYAPKRQPHSSFSGSYYSTLLSLPPKFSFLYQFHLYSLRIFVVMLFSSIVSEDSESWLGNRFYICKSSFGIRVYFIWSDTLMALFFFFQLGKKVKKDTVIPDPDYRIPIVLLGEYWIHLLESVYIKWNSFRLAL